MYPVQQVRSIIDKEISQRPKEIIAILTIGENGKKKEIQFFVNGKASKSTDASEYLKGDLLFPTIILGNPKQQVTTIPIDQIKTRTPEIENLIKEYQQKNNNNQSGGAAASSSSPAQLQQELDEALQEIAALSAELKKKDEEIAALKQQVESLKK